MKLLKLLFIVLCMIGSLSVIIILTNKKRQTINLDIELTPQMEQNIPRALRILSDDENIATTLHYVPPPETFIIPKASWEEIIFEFTDKLGAMAQWPSLRKTGLPNESLEVRVWIFIGRSQGVLRLCRYDGKWAGFYTRAAYINAKFIRNGDKWKMEYEQDFIHPFVSVLALTPQTNWENLWDKVEELGILTLPDSSALPSQGGAVDGVSYVVEINDGAQYRIYRYGNPKHQKYPEAEKMLQIIETLRNEFNQSLPANEPPWQ